MLIKNVVLQVHFFIVRFEKKEVSMDFDVHCMYILPTELPLFNCDKVNSVLHSMTPFNDQSWILFSRLCDNKVCD